MRRRLPQSEMERLWLLALNHGECASRWEPLRAAHTALATYIEALADVGCMMEQGLRDSALVQRSLADFCRRRAVRNRGHERAAAAECLKLAEAAAAVDALRDGSTQQWAAVGIYHELFARYYRDLAPAAPPACASSDEGDSDADSTPAAIMLRAATCASRGWAG